MSINKDLGIVYNSYLQRLELKISNIEEIGFNMSKFRKELSDICNEVSNSSKFNSGVASEKKLDYSKAINHIKQLLLDLDVYDIYYKVNNSCDWINARLDKSRIDRDELTGYVNEMKVNLKSIVNSETMDYDVEKHIVEKVYTTAYRIIETELILTGGSELFNYASNEDVNLSYFNTIIKNRISNMNVAERSDISLREKIYEIQKKGINSSYFDLDLIRRLIIYESDNNLKTMVNNKMDSTVNSINNTSQRISSLIRNVELKDEKAGNLKKQVSKDKKRLRQKWISLLLSASILTGVGYGLPKLEKKWETKQSYSKNRVVYSSIDDETRTLDQEIVFDEDPQTVVYIREYEEYINANKRKYTEYKIEDVTFETPEEYYDYGIENMKLSGEKHTARKGNGDEISSYLDSYTEVEYITYSENGKSLDKKNYETLQILTYFFGLLIFGVFEGFTIDTEHREYFFHKFKLLFESYSTLKNDKESYKKNKEELNKLLHELKNYLNENQEFKRQFDLLYERNKYLLNNPQALYDKVNYIIERTNIDYSNQMIKKYKIK